METATGAKIDFEALGGSAEHDRLTGRCDLVAEDEDDAIRLVRRSLSYLPQHAWQVPARLDWAPGPARALGRSRACAAGWRRRPGRRPGRGPGRPGAGGGGRAAATTTGGPRSP